MGLGTLIPSLNLNRLGAPSNPKRAAIAVIAVAAFAALLGSILVPGSFLPGIADSKVDAGTITITWQDGDRYFWLPAATKERVDASSFLAQLHGNQTIIKRSSYNTIERVVYDESEGGTDFPIEPNFLYEVAGGFVDKTITYPAQAGTTGTSFAQDIKENSNQFMRRLGSYAMSLPGIVWDDLKGIGGDVNALFHDGKGASCTVKEGCTQDKDGFAAAFFQRAKDNWPILAGILVLLFLGPLLGIDNVYLGILVGAAFLAAHFWVLAALAVAMGLLFDNNRQLDDQNATQLLFTRGGEGIVDFARANPRVIGGFAVFLAAGAAGILLAWLGHPNLTAATVAIGGLATTTMIATAGKNSRGQLTLLRLSATPAIAMFILAGINAAWLLHLGYESFGWALLIFSLLGASMWFQTQRKAARAKALGKAYNPAKARRENKEALLGRYGELTIGIKATAFLGAAAVWLAVAAFAARDYLVMWAYLVIGLCAIAVFAYIVVPAWGGAGLEDEDEEDEPEETATANAAVAE